MASLVARGSWGARAGGSVGYEAFALACRSSLPGTGLPEDLAPIALIVAGQLLIEGLARAEGMDPGPRATSG
jgi:glucosamine--fructose-6-phosphate aminotransferase (isomerizing)